MFYRKAREIQALRAELEIVKRQNSASWTQIGKSNEERDAAITKYRQAAQDLETLQEQARRLSEEMGLLQNEIDKQRLRAESAENQRDAANAALAQAKLGMQEPGGVDMNNGLVDLDGRPVRREDL